MKPFLFVFLLACFAYSQAGTIRTDKDIRDYEKFLKDSVYGKPIPSSNPELEGLQTPWSRSGKFEGDIILTDSQIEMLVDEYSGNKNANRNESTLWPNGVVNYYIDPNDFTRQEIQWIKDTLSLIEDVSCITFNEVASPNVNLGFVYVNGKMTGCSAIVGYTGTRQAMNLQPNWCVNDLSIVHEFLHALGFWHMQSTYDRDDYINIYWDNIETNQQYNFYKYSQTLLTNLGAPYDYVSIMHYGPYDGAIDPNKKTIEAKNPSQPVGPSYRMTETDIFRLNKLYKCP